MANTVHVTSQICFAHAPRLIGNLRVWHGDKPPACSREISRRQISSCKSDWHSDFDSASTSFSARSHGIKSDFSRHKMQARNVKRQPDARNIQTTSDVTGCHVVAWSNHTDTTSRKSSDKFTLSE